MQPLGPSRWMLPDPREAPDGEEVIGVGADLEPETLVDAYSRGLFPMPTEPGGPIGWWSPDPRGILPLDQLRVTRSLAKSYRRYRTTVDVAFDEVVRECGDPTRPLGWIDQQIRDAYGRLHRMGWAHSVEVWDGDQLVGGLYGIEVGGLFAGESMFHHARDASKVALVRLVTELRAGVPHEGRLLDVQWRSDHLASLGVIEIRRHEYLLRVARAVELAPALGG